MNTPARVGAFVVGLGALFGAAMGIGNAVGPFGEPAAPHAMADGGAHAMDEHASDDETAVPGGLMTSQDGYTLALRTAELASGTREVEFVVEDAEGRPLTSYAVEHERLMHLIVVRRDFTGFQHVHPVLDASGTWSAPVDLSPGSWRVFADFRPTGADGLTLGSDLVVPGDVPAPPTSPVTRTATVGDYTVTLRGDPVAGEHSMLTLGVEKDGRPVTDLQPYLGAYGHLVALREGDLAYLHVHPEDGPAGPDIEFGAEVPSVGRYHLYLDFKHEGVVRTASFVVDATRGEVTHEHD